MVYNYLKVIPTEDPHIQYQAEITSDEHMLYPREIKKVSDAIGLNLTVKYIDTLLNEMCKGMPRYYYYSKRTKKYYRCYPANQWFPIMKGIYKGGDAHG